MDVYVPLDPRPDACEITDMSALRSAEVGVTLPSLSVKELKSLAIDPKTFIIGEIDYSIARLAALLMVGDKIVKVNNETPNTFVGLSKLLASPGDITVILDRRAFVTAPGHLRVQAAMTALKITTQKKNAYQVVTCKKMPGDIFLTTSFGFTAENVTLAKNLKKFVVAEINGNTAAEKYFSVGDILVDFRGLPIYNDGLTLKQFNMTFQTVGEIDVLVERPVTVKAREQIATLIKNHLQKHDTPSMCNEVTRIGVKAARYHGMFWKRLTPVPITVAPGAGGSSPVIAIPDIATATTPENNKKEGKKKGSVEKKGSTEKKGSLETRSKMGSLESRTKNDEGQRKKTKKTSLKKASKVDKKKTARNKKSMKKKRNNSIENTKTRDLSEETRDVSIDVTSMDKDTTVGENDSPNNGRVKIVGAKSYQEITSDVAPETELESVGLRYADDFEDENTQDDDEQKKMKLARKALRPIKMGLFSTMALFKKPAEKDKEKKGQ